MARVQKASDVAKSLLHNASQRLLTADPTHYRELSDALDDSLDWPMYMEPASTPVERPFEPNFSETTANSLSFAVSPSGNNTSLSDRKGIATQSFERLVGEHFGRPALHWAEGRLEPFKGSLRMSRGLGAMFAAGMDRGGLSEASASYEWGPDTMDALPAPVYDLARIVMGSLPGLVPFYTTVHCGRRSGGQHVTFEISRALDLNNLKPVMDVLGLGHRHGALMSLAGFMLGARFVLPPETSTLTVLRCRTGVELRLDVNLDSLPDAPSQLLPLLRLPMTERPRSLQALDRWMTAMTPDGYYGPGNVSVLSIRVRGDMPPRVAIFLRPIAFTGNGGEASPQQPAADGQPQLPANGQPQPPANGQPQPPANGAPPPPGNGEISPQQMPELGAGA